jgi:HD-like signal output (HDOD) protein
LGRINIDAITPGMVLAEDLRDSNGRFLLGKGVELEETRLRILRMWGVYSVEVQGNPDDFDPSHAEEIDPAVLDAAEKQVAKRFSHGTLNQPFLKELFRICALRKAREIVRQQPPVRSGISSSLEQATVCEQGFALPFFKGQIDLQALVDREMGLASLPDVFIEISRVIGDPRSSAVHVADVISKDTSLSARLLKIVNSAFYSFPSKIDTISRAVTIVGTRQLSTLALGASVIRIFQGIPADLMDMESFWKHSIACGVSARMIASYKNISNTERLFVAGLFHDIGRIILYGSLPQVGREILLNAGRAHVLLRDTEIEALGYEHAQIGGVLLKKWKLPLILEQAVSYHHDPLKSQYPLESSIVCLSDILANALEMGSSGERLIPPLMPEVWNGVELDKEVLAEIIGLVDRQVAEIVRLFFDKG